MSNATDTERLAAALAILARQGDRSPAVALGLIQGKATFGIDTLATGRYCPADWCRALVDHAGGLNLIEGAK